MTTDQSRDRQGAGIRRRRKSAQPRSRAWWLAVCGLMLAACGSTFSDPEVYSEQTGSEARYAALVEHLPEAEAYLLVRAASPTHFELALRANAGQWRKRAQREQGELVRLFAGATRALTWVAGAPGPAPTPAYAATLLIYWPSGMEALTIVHTRAPASATARGPATVTEGLALEVTGDAGDLSYYWLDPTGIAWLRAAGLGPEPARPGAGRPATAPAD